MAVEFVITMKKCMIVCGNIHQRDEVHTRSGGKELCHPLQRTTSVCTRCSVQDRSN